MRRRVLAILILGGLLWIALPTVVLAGDCPDDRGWLCLAKWAAASPLLAAAVGALLAGTALWRSMSGSPAPPGDGPEDDVPPEWVARAQARYLDRLGERPPSEQSPAYNPTDTRGFR